MRAAARHPFKALIVLHNPRARGVAECPLHPDPQRPIIHTRTVDLPMGLGDWVRNSTTTSSRTGSGKVVAKVVAKAPRNQRLTTNTTATTAKIGPLHVCACVRARMRGIVYICGSCGSSYNKSLIRKGKSHYFAHYFATTSAVAYGSSASKSLKSFEKGDF